MYAKRYTRSQVLYGLREAWEYATGVHGEFNADTEAYSYMIADESLEDLDLCDVIMRLHKFFGFTCPQDEWRKLWLLDVATKSYEEWLKTVVPQLTFGMLADFIAERAPVVASFDPIRVFGRKCTAAGVFEGIQQVADALPGSKTDFGPSTRIFDVMRGRTLENFWTRLRWMTEDAIPELPASWRDSKVRAVGVGFLAVIGGLIIAWLLSSPVWIVPALVVAITLYVAAYLYKQTVNPIPQDIVSFRDLSLLIAKSRE